MRAPALILLTLGLMGAGWRMDGTGVYEGVTPPRLAKDGPVRFRVATTSWGNAMPVRFGGQVCITVEPTSLQCHDAETGAVTFATDHPVIDALPAGEAAAARAVLAEAEQAATQLDAALAEYSRLQRETRRSTADPSTAEALVALSARVDALKAQVDRAAAYRTPPAREIIGYASATPVVAGGAIHAVFGNGVVASHGPDGRLRWATWLGEPPRPMRGYDFGQTSSPVWADGVLVVGLGHLMGLDPDTGAVRWKGPEFRDYGTPAVTVVGGTTVVLTPAGQLVRARDGAVLQEGVGNVVYVGPVVADGVAYYAGGAKAEHGEAGGATSVSASRLVAGGGGAVRAEPLWSAQLDTRQVTYAPPVVHLGRLYLVTKRGELHVLDVADGSVVYKHDLDVLGDMYPGVVIAGGRLIIGSVSGTVIEAALGDRFVELQRTELGRGRALPWFEGDRAYVRTLDALWRLGP